MPTMPTNEDFQGVSNCYVFKSRLQEYAQKVGLPTPVYETIKEGPSHEPSFRSTVIVNDIRYDSLAGFFNRKAAEQSAAEVALMELAKTNEVNQSIKQPVHETGLCKNLLQEYAQKMNYAMPMYHSQKDETPSRAPRFTCTVDIGGILYIGGAAKTKKEAEIKAARTALLAIQSSASSSQNQLGHSQLTVIPCRKRAAETAPPVDETSKPPKPKKRFRKKSSKRKFSKDKTGRNAENAGTGANINPGVESHANISNESGFKETKCDGAFISEAMKSSENGILLNYCEKEVLVKEGSPVMNGNGSVEIGNSTKLHSKDPEASVELNKQQDNGEIINEL
ncbi:double-stranded RNA-binding protein 1-like [Arachis stenosperma]|uniref:double-stranded RNA-binding protein 1-like n=1 Tax=Arachis stenosperma TaxID=217475 RepID=UPI0025AB8A14|nr:double-stranded RNA-binding protein 1-like [Arachis stenosperma]